MIAKTLNTFFNSYANKLIRPEIRIGKWPFSVFQLCGYTGLILSFLLVVSLVTYLGLSQFIMAGIVIAAVATFFVLAMATKIIIGEERLIYYHHEIAIMLVATIVLWLLNEPILPYLDVTILGIGTFLSCGRIGCLMVGCCHGRPNHFGVCYRDEHVLAGFTPYYVGVRLFPIQAVESLWVFGTVLMGIAMVLRDFPPGAALAWYIVMYDVGRFFSEFMRGDPTRLYWKGFSEGQWTSVLLMVVVVGLEMSGKVPYESWHLGVTVLLLFIMTAVALKRRFQKTNKHQLTNPRHVRKLAEAVRAVSNSAFQQCNSSSKSIVQNNIPVRSTSLGILISGNQFNEPAAELQHYALSCREGNMTEDIAKTIARIIVTIKEHRCAWKLIKGKHGVFHLMLRRADMGQR